MKLSQELTRQQIENDLNHHYKKEEFVYKNDNELIEFFENHIKNNLEEVSIDNIFNEENYNSTYFIETPDGIQQIGEKIKKTKRECFTIKTVDDKSISCSHDHKIETPVGWKFTRDLSKKDLILTKDGFRKIKSKHKIKEQEVYDFEVLHENHRYWAGDGISSHNTGKTYLSLITSLHLLKTHPEYRKIVLIKSVTTIKGEELGFLPGTLQEKMEPYMWSYLGNLNKIFGDRGTSQKMLESGMITIEPIAYVRGNTMDNCMHPDTVIILSNNESIKVKDLYVMMEDKIDSDEKILVKSYNHELNIIENKELKEIAKMPISKKEDMFEIELLSGDIIKLTGKHKLYVKNKGYIEVEKIEEDDVLLGL
jgi:hypothetical protein